MTTLKGEIAAAVERLADDLERLSHRIHAHPELGYQEIQAAGWLAEFLASQGFEVERGVAGVETAFRATLGEGSGPTIAILCEYDALPGLGHACGHNVIAAAGAGAGAALAAVRSQLPPGRIQVLGTPAEEGGGGKIRLIRAGVFEPIDAAMMIHGFDRWVPFPGLLGVVRVGFEFIGKSAHAAGAPWDGINALDAVIQTFNNISMLRQQMRPECRIHGIITRGGDAPNIIPEFTACVFSVRAATIEEMWALEKRVVACAEGAAQSTGCTVKVLEPDHAYEPMRHNRPLLEAFQANMPPTAVGISSEASVGSSDVGNVSQVVPTIQPMVKIAPDGTPLHSRAFALAAGGPAAREGLLASARALALTTYDVLADPTLLARAKREFA